MFHNKISLIKNTAMKDHSYQVNKSPGNLERVTDSHKHYLTKDEN
jgi:hypothetical protein